MILDPIRSSIVGRTGHFQDRIEVVGVRCERDTELDTSAVAPHPVTMFGPPVGFGLTGGQ